MIHVVQTICAAIILGMQYWLQAEERDGTYPTEKLILLCEHDGWEWKIQTVAGQFFMLLHTLIMIASALQVERSFYTVFHHTQYFKGEVPLTEDVYQSLREGKAIE